MIGFIIFGGIAYLAFPSDDLKPVEPPPPATEATAAKNKAATIAAVKRSLEPVTTASLANKVQEFALQPLAPKWNPEAYAKLGKPVWDRSNQFRRWVALAALQNKNCPLVETIAVWEGATRSKLSWHVGCGNGERIIVSEEQARAAKARFDPRATQAERKKYAADDPVPKTMSAAFDELDLPRVVIACDNLMRNATVDTRGYDPSSEWVETRNEEAGYAIISRDYSAKNAVGGTLSGKYRCVVDAQSGRVVGLTVEDAFGVHRVL